MTHTYIHPCFFLSSASPFYYQVSSVIIVVTEMHFNPGCPYTCSLINSFEDYLCPSHQYLISSSEIISELMVLSEFNPKF